MRLVRRLTALLNRLVKPARDRVLARLRAHTALAVHDDLRQLALHVTAERLTLASELGGRMAAELGPIRRQLDDLNLCNDGLLREVVRLQREMQQLLKMVERLQLETSSDVSHLRLVDQREARAA